MPLERVGTREKVPTVVTKCDFKWMRLCCLAVALETIPFYEPTVGKQPTLDLVERVQSASVAASSILYSSWKSLGI
jgi:hypothetical protein